MREINKITPVIFTITAEPGDMTRYEYIAYREGPDEFTFAPTHSTFRFPQRLNSWDCKDLNEDQLIAMAQKERCNPHTLKECVNCMEEIIKKT